MKKKSKICRKSFFWPLSFAEVLAFRYSANSAAKAILPQINLTGSVLKSTEHFKDLLDGDFVWQLVGGLTQSLFNGGQLRAIAKQKRAESEASWWRYQSLVLDAMREVENVMAADRFLREQYTALNMVLHDLQKVRQSSESKYQMGVLSLEYLLQTKIQYIEKQIELDGVLAQYTRNRLALVLALGLPFENLEAQYHVE